MPPSQEWGVNISRRILHLNEESNWAPVPIRFSGNQADMAGTLRGFENLRPGRNLKIKPFLIGGGTQPAAGPSTSLGQARCARRRISTAGWISSTASRRR